MIFNAIPKLDHIVAVKIAVSLWNQHDIKLLLAEYCANLKVCWNNYEKWQVIQEKVLKNVRELAAPELLRKQVSGIIHPIGLRIKDFIESHWCKYFGIKQLSFQFFWTPRGTIDLKKTVKIIVQHNEVAIPTRYRLACIYCLEDDIINLWYQMNINDRKLFYSPESPKNIKQKFIVTLWTYQIHGEVEKLYEIMENRLGDDCTPYEYAFIFASRRGIQPACEHFVSKLSTEKKENILERVARNVTNKMNNSDGFISFTDVLYVLFSHKNDATKSLTKSVYLDYTMIEMFLNWPYQDFFIEMLTYSELSQDAYFCRRILRIIVMKVFNGCNDYDYQEVFKKLWKQMPNDVKDEVIKECRTETLLLHLFQIKYVQVIKEIFKYASCVNKIDIILSKWGKDICKNLILDGEWDLLQLYIQECLPFPYNIKEFKDLIKEHIIVWQRKQPSKYFASTINKIWDFFHWLDDLVSKCRKIYAQDTFISECEKRKAEGLDCKCKVKKQKIIH